MAILAGRCSSEAEHSHGKGKVVGSIPTIGSIQFKNIIMAVKKSFLKMQCTVCKKVNYFTKKSKAVAEKKLEISKFCKQCKKHMLHKEGRK